MNNKNGSYIFLRSTKLILILPLLMLSLSGCFWSEEEVKREEESRRETIEKGPLQVG